jgi:hypothetical protein
MSDPTPSSRAPAGVPPSGNGKYIVIVLVLIVAVVALLAFKNCGPKPPTKPPVIPTFDAAPTSHDESDQPPPPPTVDEPPDSGPNGPRVATTFDACAVKSCSGKTTPELETWMGYRAKQAHRCYDQALAQDSELKGRVTIKVRVATNGSVCAADVTDNDMGTDSVARCVAATFRNSRSLPTPKGGCVDVKVPLSFIPGGGK